MALSEADSVVDAVWQGVDRPDFGAVHSALRSHAQTTPHAIAVVAPAGDVLDYASLQAQTDQSYARLLAHGVSAQSRIATVLPNSPAAIISFLSASRIAPCAPLNPGYRQAEFETYFDSLEIDTVLLPANEGPICREIAARRNLRIIDVCVSADRDRAESEPDVVDRSAPAADAVALLLQTSGSTSRPKIVPLTHGNLGQSALDIGAVTQLVRSDRSLIVMPLFHIHGLSAVLASIVTGGSVICPPEFSAPEFFRWLDDYHPTWYTAAPSIHRSIHERGLSIGHSGGSSLRFVRSASAPMPSALLRGVEELLGVPFLEAYGMTEAAPQIASNRLPPARRKPGSVGRAAGPEVAILDVDGNPMAPGTIGEISIRGANVTGGYLANPEANTRGFVRGWFRTGDLGYLDDEGDLFVTGRLSEIINRGGEKVTPREVEDALLEHPGIAEAVVFAIADERLGQDVAAAVVPRSGHVITERTVREFAASRIADFKVPRRVVVCPALPQIGTGKQARRLLPELLGLDRDSALAAVNYVAPRDDRELALTALWQSVLDVPDVGIHDDFFALGGDSILAVQLLARVYAATGVRLPLIDIFDEASTVARMTERLGVPSAGGGQSIPALAPADPGVLSDAEEALWLAEQFDPGHPVFNVYRVLRLDHAVDGAALQQALDRVVARHAALRSTFPAPDGQPLRSVSASTQIELLRKDSSDIETAMQLALQTSVAPFDIAVGPLFRAVLIRVSTGEALLVIVAHHIVADAWSLQVLLQDLAACYRNALGMHVDPLLPLRLEPRDFAAWQRREQRAALSSQVNYWKTQLAGAPDLLALPVDRPRPSVRSFRGARHPLVIPAPLAGRLEALGQEERATPFMVLLAGFGLLLSGWTGENDLMVGTHLAGRGLLEVEQLVGTFINTVGLRIQVDSSLPFRNQIGRARATALGAYANGALPFPVLLETVRPQRSQAYAPLFQVKLRLQNVPTNPVRFGDVDAEPVELDYGYVKVDLSLELVARGDAWSGFVEYNSDIFDAVTIARLTDQFLRLLQAASDNPDRPMREALSIVTRRGNPMSDETSPNPTSPRGARRPVSVATNALVNTGRLPNLPALPLVITPAAAGVDLLSWAAANRQWIDDLCGANGALLFRGFHVADVATFEAFAKTCTRTLLEYRNRSTPRSKVAGEVYTSTEFPADQSIPMHNEMSYTSSWPLKIWFHCVTPSLEGGETPFADSAEVYRHIPAAIRDKFADKGVAYVRNFSRQRSDGFDLSWPDTFQTESVPEVEAFCRENGIEWEWLPGERLRTRQVCQAVAPHYATGTMLWFNQAHLFHISSLRPEIQSELVLAFAPEDLPRNSYYGDGTEIEPEALAAIRAAYAETAIAFPWQAGDIVMLDNMRVAHGRNPFRGPRKIVVAMAEAFSLGAVPGV